MYSPRAEPHKPRRRAVAARRCGGRPIGAAVAVRAVRAGHRVRASLSGVTSLVCCGVLALALSPWGRTAKVWLLD